MKVSIVIPVYNRKEILAKTLAGIIHQTYPLELIEVIIADDGSKDSPEELIPIFEEYFSIKHVFQKDDITDFLLFAILEFQQHLMIKLSFSIVICYQFLLC